MAVPDVRSQIKPNGTYIKKEISKETLARIRELDLKDFAEKMGDILRRNGRSYMTYRNGGEKSPSLAITPSKKMWRDFPRDLGGKDVLSYYAYRKWDTTELKGQRFIEAVQGVCAIAGLPVIYSDGTVEQPDRQLVVEKASEFVPEREASPKKDDRTLDYFYRHMLEMLHITDAHQKHLMEERGMTHKEIVLRQYRSISDNRRSRYVLAKELMHVTKQEPIGIPGFAEFEGANGPYWTLVGRNGFLIPFRNTLNQICGFQVRVDEPNIVQAIGDIRLHLSNERVEAYHRVTEDLIWSGTRSDLPVDLEAGRIELYQIGKYLWLSTRKDPRIKCLRGAEIGNPTPAPVHTAVPSDILKVWESGDHLTAIMDTSVVWWGEGPLKGDIAAEYSNQVHLQIAGISSYEQLLEPTLELDAAEVIIAFDADVQTKVDNVGRTYLQLIEFARRELGRRGIQVKVALWNHNQAKGLDDLLARSLRPRIMDL